MGESAVLFHSYSFAAPLSCYESHKDNPMDALSQSVSFGRFMTENLEWGKWSSFSHNKYVDEAEKFSQPGSVAQKKAFFEAHYKRISDSKKSKTSIESSDQKQQPESVSVLLNTLETLTKDDVQEEESDEDEEPKIKSFAVLEQEDELQVVHEIENDTEDGELLKKSCFAEEEEEEEETRSITKNSVETQDTTMELVLSEKISEILVTHSSMKKKMEKPVHQRFSFLKCFIGNAKTQDQNTTWKKTKTDKKQKKQFLCLCFKPEMVGETASTKTQRRNL